LNDEYLMIFFRQNLSKFVKTFLIFPFIHFRLGPHADYGTITFLIQDDVGGLEARDQEGNWVPVPPIPNSIVLNAGLILEMWSGGLFPAPVRIFD